MATEPGYFFTEPQLLEFTEAAFTYEAESQLWQDAYWEQNRTMSQMATEYAAYRRDRDLALSQERSAREAEKTSYETALRSAKRQARLPGWGVFAGMGYTFDEFRFTVGVGFVLKF